MQTLQFVQCYMCACFQGWPFGIWGTNVLFCYSLRRLSLQLSAVFVVCSSLPRVEASWVSPLSLASLLLPLLSSFVMSRAGKTLWVMLLKFLGDTNSLKTQCSSSSSNLPATSYETVCDTQVGELQMCLLGLGCRSLHFECLWFSVVVSVCCKESFLP